MNDRDCWMSWWLQVAPASVYAHDPALFVGLMKMTLEGIAALHAENLIVSGADCKCLFRGDCTAHRFVAVSM